MTFNPTLYFMRSGPTLGMSRAPAQLDEKAAQGASARSPC